MTFEHRRFECPKCNSVQNEVIASDPWLFESASMIENPNLWWVSSPEDDVAYIARPGNHYRAWTTYGWKPGHANFVGIPFETIEEALAAVAKEATS